MTKPMEANHLHDKKASEQKHAVGAVLPVAAQGVMSARSNTNKNETRANKQKQKQQQIANRLSKMRVFGQRLAAPVAVMYDFLVFVLLIGQPLPQQLAITIPARW